MTRTLLEKYPVLALTEEQVKQVWREKQAHAKAKGQPYYTKCVDPITNEVWIEI